MLSSICTVKPHKPLVLLLFHSLLNHHDCMASILMHCPFKLIIQILTHCMHNLIGFCTNQYFYVETREKLRPAVATVGTVDSIVVLENRKIVTRQ